MRGLIVDVRGLRINVMLVLAEDVVGVSSRGSVAHAASTRHTFMATAQDLRISGVAELLAA